MNQKTKEYQKKYREKHKAEHRAYCKDYWRNNHQALIEKKKQYYQTHKDEIKSKTKQYYVTHKNERKETDKLYHQKNKEHRNEQKREWYAKHREHCLRQKSQYYQEHKETKDEYDKNWKKLHPDKVKETMGKVNHRRQELGFNPLNNCFIDSEAHHIDIKNIIFIPGDVHKGVHHDLSKPETMTKINILAWTCLESGAY